MLFSFLKCALFECAPMPKIGFFSKALLAGLIYIFLTVMYVATNHWIQYRHAFLVHTSIEDRIPLIPEFIYIYAFGYIILLAFPIIFVNIREDFILLCKGVMWIIVSSGLIFCIFPTTTIRPELSDITLASHYLSVFYRIDPPNNCFPSLHVALTSYIGVVLHQHGYWKNYPLIISALVCASTLFIKEHALIDIFGGLIYSYLTLTFFVKEGSKDKQISNK